MQKLIHLDLYHNYLGNDAIPIISQIKSLKHLDISGNELTEIDNSISQLENLIELQLDNSWLEGVPVGTCLEKFPKSVCKLPRLEVLTLSGQCLTSIPKEIGNLKFLQALNLGYNEFTSLPEEITLLSELELLNIDMISLGSWVKLCEVEFHFPENFCHLKKLKEFYYGDRKMVPSEMERIQSCLPECEM